MKFEATSLEKVFVITLDKFIDERGWFNRMFCSREFEDRGIHFDVTQINQSFTALAGTFRGVHYQYGPFAEYKLVRCLKGSVLDFAVDLRKESKTLFKHFSVELSDSNNKMLLLPPCVGHAFQSLENNSELIYLHSSFYNKEYEGGVKYNDPLICLNLPKKITQISERDSNHSLLEKNFIGL